MVGRIPEKVHKRITDFINNGSVKFCLFTCHVKFHFLVKFFTEISYHSWKSVYNCLNRNHSYIHDRFMKVGCNSFKIFYLFINTLVLFRSRSCRSRYQTILGNNKFADKVHQHIKLVNIHSD